MKKIRRILIFFFIVFILVVISISYLRYEALKRISDFVKIYGTFSSLDLKPLPPSLTVTELTIEIPNKVGKLSVKNAKIEVATRGLFAKKLIFRVDLNTPHFILYRIEGSKGRKRELPNFDIENGRVINGCFTYSDGGKELILNSINGSLYWKNKRLGLNIRNSSGKIRDEKSRVEEEFLMKLLLRSEPGRIRIRELEIKSQYGLISTRGTIYSKENELEANGEIKGSINKILDYKKIKLSSNIEGSVALQRINESIRTELDFSISPKVNEKVMNVHVSAKFDEKLNGEANLKANYKRKNWFCDVKISEGKFYNLNLKDFPLEFFDSILPIPIREFFLNFNGEAKKDRVTGEFFVYSDGESLKGNIDFGKNKFRGEIDEINIKGAKGTALINSVGRKIEITGRFDSISLREILDSKILNISNLPAKLPEVEGIGNCEFKISGTIDAPEIISEFIIKNLKISGIDLENLRGEIKGIKDEIVVEGSVEGGIFDGSFKGAWKDKSLKIEIEKANSQNLWKELKGDLKGVMSFSFREGIEGEGKISSSLVMFRELELRDLSIPFNFKNKVFLSSFSFSTPQSDTKGNIEIDFKDMKLRISVSKISIDVSKIYNELGGKLYFSINGEGSIYHSPIEITGKIYEISYKSGGSKNFDIKSEITFSKNKAFFKGKAESFNKDESLNFNFEISKDGYINGRFEGNLNGLEKIIEEFPAEKVKAKFIGEVKGKLSSPRISSISNVEGESFFIKGFAHDFKDFSGILIQENSSLHLRNFKAKVGGGEVEGYGEAKIVEWTLKDIKLNLTGTKMRLSPFERVNGFGDGKIEIRGNLEEITIKGNFLIHYLIWRKEIGERIAFSSTPSKGPPKIFKKINLDIELQADGNAWMENSWGKAEGKFFLRIKGDSNNPVILGNITGTRGELNLGDRKFKLIRAEIYFNSPFIIDPEIYILADTFVKDYRVTFEVRGRASKPLPQLSSSPPLSPQDILTLLALGEIYQRTSYRTGTQLGSASLLSMELSEQIKTRAKKLFGVDRLRVDPYLLGSSSNPVARLTVGKKISKDLIIIYSSDLTGQREYIVYMEYSISDNFSLIGMRNENGAFSIDLKFIKRLGQ